MANRFFIVEASKEKDAAKGGTVRGSFEPEARLYATKAKKDGSGGGRQYIAGTLTFVRGDDVKHQSRVQVYVPNADGSGDREFTPITL